MTPEERKAAKNARQKRWMMKAKTEAARKAARKEALFCKDFAACVQNTEEDATKPEAIEHVQRARLFNEMYNWIETAAERLPALAHWRDAAHDKQDGWHFMRLWLRENLDQAKALLPPSRPRAGARAALTRKTESLLSEL